MESKNPDNKPEISPETPKVKADDKLEFIKNRFMCPIHTNNKYNNKDLCLDELPDKERLLLLDKKQIKHPAMPILPRNADGSVKIVDAKQEQIDRLTQQIESLPEGKQLLQVEEQQKKIDRLTEHLTLMTKQINALTVEIKSQK